MRVASCRAALPPAIRTWYATAVMLFVAATLGWAAAPPRASAATVPAATFQALTKLDRTLNRFIEGVKHHDLGDTVEDVSTDAFNETDHAMETIPNVSHTTFYKLVYPTAAVDILLDDTIVDVGNVEKRKAHLHGAQDWATVLQMEVRKVAHTPGHRTPAEIEADDLVSLLAGVAREAADPTFSETGLREEVRRVAEQKGKVLAQLPKVFGLSFASVALPFESILIDLDGVDHSHTTREVLLYLERARATKERLEQTLHKADQQVVLYTAPSSDAELYGITSGDPGASGHARAAAASGSLWAVEANADNIARIGTDGSIKQIPLPPGSAPAQITTASDGTVWFTENGTDSLGQITDANGDVTQHPLPALGAGTTRGVWGIAPGPGGSIWFTEQSSNAIGELTSSGVLHEYPIPVTGVVAGQKLTTSDPFGITEGPDGAMWFTMALAHEIGHVTTTGQMSFFPLPSGDIGADLVSGPDHALWIAIDGTVGGVGRMSATGRKFKLFSPPGHAFPTGIALGPDGNLWYADSSATAGAIGTVTPSGKVAVIHAGIRSTSQPTAITVGPDGRMWFTLVKSNQIGAITPR